MLTTQMFPNLPVSLTTVTGSDLLWPPWPPSLCSPALLEWPRNTKAYIEELFFHRSSSSAPHQSAPQQVCRGKPCSLALRGPSSNRQWVPGCLPSSPRHLADGLVLLPRPLRVTAVHRRSAPVWPGPSSVQLVQSSAVTVVRQTPGARRQ